jgi:hypothetical protein
MLFLLKRIKSKGKAIYLGDKITIYYRFRGVFCLISGFCILKKKKTILIYEKKKQHHVFFLATQICIQKIDILHSYFFDNLKYKLYKKTKNYML